jgi:hypothetical protein
MQILIILGIFLTFLWLNKPNKDRKEVYFYTIITFVSVWNVVYQFVYRNDKIQFTDIYWLLIPLVTSLIIRIIFNRKINDKSKILAPRVSFWGVSEHRIYEAFEHRIENKKGRNEIKEPKVVHFYEKLFDGDKILYPFIWNDIKNYNDFVKIESLEYFKKDATELVKVIYDKMVEINERNEKDLNFNRILTENDNVLEFFILDLWEKIVETEIRGVATLNVLAKDEHELDLIDALDSSISANVRKGGIALYSHYANFKNRLV